MDAPGEIPPESRMNTPETLEKIWMWWKDGRAGMTEWGRVSIFSICFVQRELWRSLTELALEKSVPANSFVESG